MLLLERPMVLLEDYVKDFESKQMSIEEYLAYSLVLHLEAEDKDIMQVSETLGQLPHSGEIAWMVVDKMSRSKLKGSYEFDVSEYGIFIKRLFVNVNANSSMLAGEFIPDELTKDAARIDIDIPPKLLEDGMLDATCDDEVAKLIIHELLHAYEAWARVYDHNQSLQHFIDANKYVHSSVKYLMYQGQNRAVILRKIAVQFAYLFNDAERNAYFSQLKEDIFRYVRDNHVTWRNLDYKKIVQDIRKLDIWKQYFEAYENAYNLKNGNFDVDDERTIARHYAKETQQLSKSANKIINEIWNKAEKFRKKFETLFPKILFDAVQ